MLSNYYPPVSVYLCRMPDAVPMPVCPCPCQWLCLCSVLTAYRHTRIVVVGKKAELVTRVLFCLSYFIRCTELSARHEHADAQCPPLQVRLYPHTQS